MNKAITNNKNDYHNSIIESHFSSEIYINLITEKMLDLGHDNHFGILNYKKHVKEKFDNGIYFDYSNRSFWIRTKENSSHNSNNQNEELNSRKWLNFNLEGTIIDNKKKLILPQCIKLKNQLLNKHDWFNKNSLCFVDNFEKNKLIWGIYSPKSYLNNFKEQVNTTIIEGTAFIKIKLNKNIINLKTKTNLSNIDGFSFNMSLYLMPEKDKLRDKVILVYIENYHNLTTKKGLYLIEIK
jgi:hypothetical protein